MYIKYAWTIGLSVSHDIHSKIKVIYFEQGLVHDGGFVAEGFCLYPDRYKLVCDMFEGQFPNCWPNPSAVVVS